MCTRAHLLHDREERENTKMGKKKGNGRKGKEKITGHHPAPEMALCGVHAVGSLGLVLTGPHAGLWEWPWL